MYNAKAYSAASATSPLAHTQIPRRDPTPNTTCRSKSSSAASATPTSIRSATSGASSCPRSTRSSRAMRSSGGSPRSAPRSPSTKPGDLAAVGCLVDSDRTCPQCKAGLEQFCPNLTLTFNSPDKHLGGVTYGGYSDSIVVDERFVLRVPANLNLAGAAPLLCAGITTYSPMRHWGVTKGKKVGIVGLGGLGHMGVKFAHAFGAHVVVFTTSPNKKEDALRLGADEVVVSRNAERDEEARRQLRLHPRRRRRRARHQRLYQPARPRRQPHPRRRSGEAAWASPPSA